MPALQANALYEGKYPLVSALRRPVIVRHLVSRRAGTVRPPSRMAVPARATTRCASRSGVARLAPDLEIFAPAREWGLTREECVELAAKWDIPITATKEKLYSIDDNLWGEAIECGAIEDPWAPRPMTCTPSPRVTVTEPVEVIVGFEAGVPVSLDGTPSPRTTSSPSWARWREPGFGRLDMVENRRVGIKSREIYECPAAPGADHGPRRSRGFDARA